MDREIKRPVTAVERLTYQRAFRLRGRYYDQPKQASTAVFENQNDLAGNGYRLGTCGRRGQLCRPNQRALIRDKDSAILIGQDSKEARLKRVSSMNNGSAVQSGSVVAAAQRPLRCKVEEQNQSATTEAREAMPVWLRHQGVLSPAE